MLTNEINRILGSFYFNFNMGIHEILKTCYRVLNDFQGSIIAVITLAITYPILQKKLLENHISNALSDIQIANNKLILKSTELIDEFIPHTYKNEILRLDELQYLTKVIKELQVLSLEANKDSNTIILFLKITLQNTIKHYDSTKHGIISSREILGIIIRVLEQVIYFSTQVVQIPKSSKTSKNNLINKKISKYVTHSEFEKYKYFKQGFIDDAKSAHFILFYSYVVSTSTNLITRSAFQIFENTFPIQSMAFIREFYAPFHLEQKETIKVFSDDLLLQLMGFEIRTSLSAITNSSKKIIVLNYTNPSDFFGFTDSLDKETIIKAFKDILVEDSGFDLSKMNSFSKQDKETITIEFDFEYCQSLFKNNKRSMRKLLKNNS